MYSYLPQNSFSPNSAQKPILPNALDQNAAVPTEQAISKCIGTKAKMVVHPVLHPGSRFPHYLLCIWFKSFIQEIRKRFLKIYVLPI